MIITIIITSHKEPETLPKAIDAIIKSIDSSKLNESFEILVVGPDKNTRNIANKYKQVSYIKDKGKGKPAALNIAFKYAKGEIIILTDGDVIIGKDSIEEILKPFKPRYHPPQAEVRGRHKNIGAVSGQPVSMNSKKTLFGYWSYFLTHAAHKMRLHSKTFPCSGYLYAIRNNIINNVPENIFSEDAYITQIIQERGYMITYAAQAKVYVKYPDNLKDWFIQKIRSTGGYIPSQIFKENLEGRAKFKTKSMRSFWQEALDGIKLFFTYPKTVKEFFWTILLYIARVFLWCKILWKIKIKKQKFSTIWQRVESTK